MSTYPRKFSSTPTTIVEHVVLFKTREDAPPEKIDAMVSDIRGLTTVEPVLYLTAGPITRDRSSSSQFTHLLHSRYRDKDGLHEYIGHDKHLSVSRDFISPLCDEALAVDWVVDLDGHVVPTSGALRLTLLKPKDDLSDEVRDKVVQVFGRIKDSFSSIEQVSFGENFSPAYAKGYTLCFLSYFPSLNEIDASEMNEELIKMQKDEVRPLLESIMVIDYEIPLPSFNP